MQHWLAVFATLVGLAGSWTLFPAAAAAVPVRWDFAGVVTELRSAEEPVASLLALGVRDGAELHGSILLDPSARRSQTNLSGFEGAVPGAMGFALRSAGAVG